jgi:hypothetical protein
MSSADAQPRRQGVEFKRGVVRSSFSLSILAEADYPARKIALAVEESTRSTPIGSRLEGGFFGIQAEPLPQANNLFHSYLDLMMCIKLKSSKFVAEKT